MLFVLQMLITILFLGRFWTDKNSRTTENSCANKNTGAGDNFIQRFDDNFLINVALKRNNSETKNMLFLSNSLAYIAYSVPAALYVDGVIRHDDEMRQNALYIGSSAAIDLGVTLLLKTVLSVAGPLFKI